MPIQSSTHVLILALFAASACSTTGRERAADAGQSSEVALASTLTPTDTSNDTVVVGFWNVENLFDTEDDPGNEGDDEYLPDRGWTPERYALKLDRLAEVIAAVGPHLLGVCEVENRRVLEDLVAHPRLGALDYRIAHLDSPDKRGIDCACVYRAPFGLADIEPAIRIHPFEKEGEAPTRGVFEVRLEAHGYPLSLLVNHWPSRGGDRDGAFRAIAGARVREVVDQEIARAAEAGEPEPDVLIIGDFNDDPFDPALRDSLGAARSRNAVLNRRQPRLLYNTSWRLLGRPDEGTLYYNNDWVWNVFDQLICSRGLLDDEGFGYVEDSFDAFGPEHMRDHYRRPLRFRQNRDGSWQEGYSDHFLVHARLRIAPEGER